MTGCASDDNAGSLGFSADPLSGSKSVPLPRFSLRKRKPCPDRGALGLPSVSSALLDGIFADVAEILQSEGTERSGSDSSSSPSSCEERTSFIQMSPPAKKSRSSLTHSISRSPKSFKSLGEMFFPSSHEIKRGLVSPSYTPPDLTLQVTAECNTKKRTVVSQPKISEFPTSAPLGASPSFPHLPPAVSVSSCNTLTRVLSDLQDNAIEPEGKDSYGWFIEMDNAEEEKETVDPYTKSSSSNNLAFVAATAPSVGNHDAEVEWAKAADTVDSVLGDFF